MNFLISPKSILLCLIGLGLIPRLFSSYALQIGTIYILFFWLPLLVILPEITKNYDIKLPLSKLPSETKAVVFVSLIFIFLLLIFRERVFDSTSGPILANIRRSTYLLQPLICLSLFPYVIANKKKFIGLILFMTLVLGFALITPSLLENTNFSNFLNQLTARSSALLYSLVHNVDVTVENVYFGNSNFLIEVMHGCSSIHQIVTSLFVLIILYLCCNCPVNISFQYINCMCISLNKFLWTQ